MTPEISRPQKLVFVGKRIGRSPTAENQAQWRWAQTAFIVISPRGNDKAIKRRCQALTKLVGHVPLGH